MQDRFGRAIEYMRISITDRCNLRCRYCMPEDIRQVPMQELLTYEEIEEICQAAAGCGITRFKVTGGEPLVRRGCAELVRMIKAVPGTEQVTMTTNGVLLKEMLPALLQAGLDAVNISLDTLDPGQFRRLTGADSLEQVLGGIEAAVDAGIPVKLNCVPQKGFNDQELWKILHLAAELPVDVRFIEMMPIGYGKQQKAISNEDLLKQIRTVYPGLEPDSRRHGNGPAVYWKIPGFMGSVGLISAMHGKFCSACNRIRMTATGQIKPCLASGETVDLRTIVRIGDRSVRQVMLAKGIEDAIRRKPAEHCFEQENQETEHRPMIEIGG